MSGPNEHDRGDPSRQDHSRPWNAPEEQAAYPVREVQLGVRSMPPLRVPLVSAIFLSSSAGPGSRLPISSSFTVRAFAVSSAVSSFAISPGPISSSGIPASEHERRPWSSRSVPAPSPARSLPRGCLWTSSGRARSLPSSCSATENCHSLPVLSASEGTRNRLR